MPEHREHRFHGLRSPGVCTGIVIAMLAMIVIPAAIMLQASTFPPRSSLSTRSPRRTASPRTDKLIDASIQWAERIMRTIGRTFEKAD